VPVDTFRFEHGFYDVLGNVWQWTETPIDEFEGFRVHPVYDDFSVPTFDTRHNMIKGGSWISTGNEATFHGRYAFRRHFFQNAGFRFVQSDAPLSFRPEVFERDEKVVKSLEVSTLGFCFASFFLSFFHPCWQILLFFFFNCALV
jgi:hypothetical protein